MRNLGSIGSIEILQEPGVSVALKLDNTIVVLTLAQAADLSDVISYAMTDQMYLLPECETFKPNYDFVKERPKERPTK